jgi:sugar phosphate isomerase/epimerase
VDAFNIGIQLASLRMPLKQALHTAAKLGARGVEIDARHSLKPQEMTRTAVRHLRKMLDDLNLRVCAVGFPTRRGYDEVEQLEPRIEGTKRAMDLAWQLGARVVINQVGSIPDQPDDSRWNILRQALTDIGNHGQHVGSWLAADTGGDDGQRLKSLIDALPSGMLAVNFNPGRLIVHGQSPEETLRALAGYVQHVHATDGVRDITFNRGQLTQLGRGSVDYPVLLGILEEQQYPGYFTVQREPSPNVVAEIRDGVKYLQAIMQN